MSFKDMDFVDVKRKGDSRLTPPRDSFDYFRLAPEKWEVLRSGKVLSVPYSVAKILFGIEIIGLTKEVKKDVPEKS